MATFELEKGGKTYEVEAPDQAAALAALPQIESGAVAKAKPEPSAGADFVKSAAIGAVKGPINFAGLPGDVSNLLAKGSKAAGDYIGGAMGFEPSPELHAPVLPTSGGIQKAIESKTGEFYQPKTSPGKFAGAATEVLGNPATYLGPGSMALKAGAGVATGLGSEAVGELAEGTGFEPAARLAGGVLAGAGGATAASERNLSKLAAQLPTRDSIKAAATAGYDTLKRSNTQISPQATQQLHATVKYDLDADHFRDYLAPTTYRAIDELAVGGSATIGDLDGVRRLLNRVPGTNPTDRDAANRAIRAIDDFLINVDPRHVISGDPARDAAILKQAQGNWALHKQLETVEEASVKGQHRAGVSGSGANRVNTARQEIRKILDSDKKSRGMSDAVRDKMEEIVMGTWLSNAARKLGKFSPEGPVSSGATIAAGFAGGAGAAAGTAAAGWFAKNLGEYLTDRQIKQLEQLMRSESPIGKPIASAIAPEVAEQSAVPAAAVTRSALTAGSGSALSQP